MKQGQRGCCPFPLHPKSPLESSSASLRIIALDDSEHLLHNHHASVASLRLLFTFVPECRSASLRNQRSPSPEYPTYLLSRHVAHFVVLGERASTESAYCGIESAATIVVGRKNLFQRLLGATMQVYTDF
jgi:hypothetical protein